MDDQTFEDIRKHVSHRVQIALAQGMQLVDDRVQCTALLIRILDELVLNACVALATLRAPHRRTVEILRKEILRNITTMVERPNFEKVLIHALEQIAQEEASARSAQA
jgi:hypothetical protein